MVTTPELFKLFMIVFADMGFRAYIWNWKLFFYNFWGIALRFWWYSLGILMAFCWIVIFTLLILLNHDHERTFDLLISFSILSSVTWNFYHTRILPPWLYKSQNIFYYLRLLGKMLFPWVLLYANEWVSSTCASLGTFLFLLACFTQLWYDSFYFFLLYFILTIF